jgi:3-oxoacyl-[acyl-carrier protein] reductase
VRVNIDLSGKVALVTGGSRGIGAAVAAQLAAAGADIALTYQKDAHAAEGAAKAVSAHGRRALTIAADSADADAVAAAVERTVDEMGRLDILVNNAAQFQIGPPDQLTVDDFDRMFAVNVRAPWVASRAAAAHLPRGGRIITVGSNMVQRTVFPGFSLYSASKTALVGLTKGLSRDLGPAGVTVNLVNPGPTDTDMNPAENPMAGVITGFTALGRYGQPSEIATAVVFLAGDAAAYLTGAVIDVDGGFSV